MKATELKIGDLVEYNARTGVITSLTERVCAISMNKKDTEYPLLDKVRPIPLTKQILKKNGWKEVSMGIYDYSVFSSKFIHDKNPTLYMKDGIIYHRLHQKTKLEFVHQLQHILWALGLDDN